MTTDLKTAALKVLADYPLENQFGTNELIDDDCELWGADDWRLTAGDVRRARVALAATPGAAEAVPTIDEPWASGYSVRVGRDNADCIDLVFVSFMRHEFQMYTNEAAYLRDLLNHALPAAPAAEPAGVPDAGVSVRKQFEAWHRAHEGYPLAGKFLDLMWPAFEAAHALGRQQGMAQAKAESASGTWQSIETAPKDGSYVLVSNGHGAWIARWAPIAASGYRFDRPWQSCMLNHDHIELDKRHLPPTKWQPLPQQPGQEKA